tara:strand:- start:1434 stop:3377 length:1944 start_codon:yes stop_codon:yes gene_type:complete
MEKIVVELDVKSKGGVQEVEKLNKKLTETKTQSKEAGASLNGVSGGAIGKFNGLKNSITGVVTGFKSLKFAILASGIGALLLAVLAVGKAFTNSEEGQNKFAKIMGVIGSVTGNLVDILASLGEKIISVFENPKQAIADFSNLIKDNIINRFTGILELIPSLSKSIKQLFSGDFSGAAQTAGNAVAKVVLGTDNLTDSIKRSAAELKKFAAEVAADAKSAGEIADQRAKADKIERRLIVERAEADKEIAELRFKTEQRDKFSAKERIKFLKDASKISEDIAAKEIGLNNIRLNAQIAENKLAGSKKADLNAVAELTAKSIQLETSKLSLQKRLQTSLTSFQTEELAGIKTIADERKKVADERNKQLEKEEAERIKKVNEEAKTESERLKNIAAIQDEFTKRREDELAVTNIQKLELEKERKILALEQLGADEQAKADVILFYAQKIAEENIAIQKKEGEEKVANAKAVADAEAAIRQGNINNVGAGFALLGQLAGKNRALQSAALIGESAVGIAKTVINTQAANSAATLKYALLPGGIALAAAERAINNVSAGISIASNIAATSKGLSQLKGGGSAPSGGVRGGSGARGETVQSTPPAFNIVGQSNTNQLADAIGGQSKQPTRAYVVSGDVTNAQEMDRNIIQGASI